MIYFAYGSSLDPCQIVARCPGSTAIGSAMLTDHKLIFPRRSEHRRCAVASLAAAHGEEVWGVLYELCDSDVTALHRHEGYDPSCSEKENRYVVRRVEVLRTALSTPVMAYTYVAIPTDAPGLPSADYLGHLIRGAAYHQLPESWLRQLAAIPTM